MRKITLPLLFILLNAINAFSQAEYYNTSFGDDGMAVFDTPGQSSFTKMIKVNDKIYTLSTTFDSPEEITSEFYYSIKSFNTDGTLDTSFSFSPSLEGNYWHIRENFQGFLSITSNNKLLMGHNSFNLTGQEDLHNIVRLNSDGTIDTSYGTNGFADMPQADNLPVRILNIEKLENNELLVTGTNDQSFFTCKFDSNGSMYTNIWNNGQLTYNYTYSLESAVQSLYSATDNSIYLLFNNGAPYNVFIDAKIVKLNLQTGLPDPAFGTNGSLTFNEKLKCIALTDENKLLIISTSTNQCNLRRYNNNGTQDSSFANGGAVLIDTANFYIVRKMHLENEKITVLRHTDTETGFILQRFNMDGTVDSGFGTTGKITRAGADTPYGGSILGYDILNLENQVIVSGSNNPDPMNDTLDSALFGFLYSGNLATGTIPATNGLALYPNPASDVVFIKSASPVKTAEIYNTAGQLIASINVTGNKIDTGFLSTGAYILKLQDSENNREIKKLVKI